MQKVNAKKATLAPNFVFLIRALFVPCSLQLATVSGPLQPRAEPSAPVAPDVGIRGATVCVKTEKLNNDCKSIINHFLQLCVCPVCAGLEL